MAWNQLRASGWRQPPCLPSDPVAVHESAGSRSHMLMTFPSPTRVTTSICCHTRVCLCQQAAAAAAAAVAVAPVASAGCEEPKILCDDVSSRAASGAAAGTAARGEPVRGDGGSHAADSGADCVSAIAVRSACAVLSACAECVSQAMRHGARDLVCVLFWWRLSTSEHDGRSIC